MQVYAKSNYDLEILIGAGAIKRGIQAMFDAGQLSQPFQSEQLPIAIQLLSIDDVSLIFDEVDCYATSGVADIRLDFSARIRADENKPWTEFPLELYLNLEFKYTVNPITKFIDRIGIMPHFKGITTHTANSLGDSALLFQLLISLGFLEAYIAQQDPDWVHNIIDFSAQKVGIIKHNATDTNPACLGLYINLPFKRAETFIMVPETAVVEGVQKTIYRYEVSPPEPDEHPINVGNELLGVNFLPNGKDLAVAAPADIYKRLATHQLHMLAEQKDDGTWWRPLRYGMSTASPVIGYVKGINVEPPLPIWGDDKTYIKEEIHFYSSDHQVDVRLPVYLNLDVDQNGKLTAALKIGEPDIETGFFEGLIMALGSLVGMAFVPLTGGLSLLAFGEMSVLFVGALKGVIDMYEKKFQRMLQEEVDSLVDNAENEPPGKSSNGIDAIVHYLSALPAFMTVVTRREDPFYTRHYGIAARFDNLNVEFGGIYMTAEVDTEIQNWAIQDVQMVGRIRTEEPVGELQHILFQVPQEEKIENPDLFFRPEPDAQPGKFGITLNEFIQREKEGLIRYGFVLTPCAVRISRGKISELFFEEGPAFKQHEIVEMYMNRLASMPRCKLIRPLQEEPYFRSKSNWRTSDNLSELQRYKCYHGQIRRHAWSKLHKRLFELLDKVKILHAWNFTPENWSQAIGARLYHLSAAYQYQFELLRAAMNLVADPGWTETHFRDGRDLEDTGRPKILYDKVVDRFNARTESLENWLSKATEPYLNREAYLLLFEQNSKTVDLIDWFHHYVSREVDEIFEALKQIKT